MEGTGGLAGNLRLFAGAGARASGGRLVATRPEPEPLGGSSGEKPKGMLLVERSGRGGRPTDQRRRGWGESGVEEGRVGATVSVQSGGYGGGMGGARGGIGGWRGGRLFGWCGRFLPKPNAHTRKDREKDEILTTTTTTVRRTEEGGREGETSRPAVPRWCWWWGCGGGTSVH